MTILRNESGRRDCFDVRDKCDLLLNGNLESRSNDYLKIVDDRWHTLILAFVDSFQRFLSIIDKSS